MLKSGAVCPVFNKLVSGTEVRQLPLLVWKISRYAKSKVHRTVKTVLICVRLFHFTNILRAGTSSLTALHEQKIIVGIRSSKSIKRLDQW